MCLVSYVHYISLLWLMSFGLEPEGGSLITPMALAYPLHPINNRSRNKRRNLQVGRCASSWWPLCRSGNSVLICISIYTYTFCYMSSVIGRIYTQGVSFGIGEAAPHQSLQDYFGRVCGSCVECHFFVFCGLPIVSCSAINSLILGCLWPFVFI